MSSSQQMTITADEINTIANIKANIFEKTKLPLDNLKISYRGKQLEDHRTLAHYNTKRALFACQLRPQRQDARQNTDITLDVEHVPRCSSSSRSCLDAKNINADRMYIVTGDQILNDDQDVTEVVRHGKDLGMHVGKRAGHVILGPIMRTAVKRRAADRDQTDDHWI
ncbi:polyubiquitin-like [Strongylocentrotus purpuratus]|uniref:Ubiquitin-like domain-containing protein n=1 Tax=Strongylocentrotus purpuratus TaxID=7668 RepID=A0A7M7NJH2_STRPU|nr:polyubiquitin-like [Strongylocentrotus purpuratus]